MQYLKFTQKLQKSHPLDYIMNIQPQSKNEYQQVIDKNSQKTEIESEYSDQNQIQLQKDWVAKGQQINEIQDIKSQEFIHIDVENLFMQYLSDSNQQEEHKQNLCIYKYSFIILENEKSSEELTPQLLKTNFQLQQKQQNQSDQHQYNLKQQQVLFESQEQIQERQVSENEHQIKEIDDENSEELLKQQYLVYIEKLQQEFSLNSKTDQQVLQKYDQQKLSEKQNIEEEQQKDQSKIQVNESEEGQKKEIDETQKIINEKESNEQNKIEESGLLEESQILWSKENQQQDSQLQNKDQFLEHQDILQKSQDYNLEQQTEEQYQNPFGNLQKSLDINEEFLNQVNLHNEVQILEKQQNFIQQQQDRKQLFQAVEIQQNQQYFNQGQQDKEKLIVSNEILQKEQKFQQQLELKQQIMDSKQILIKSQDLNIYQQKKAQLQEVQEIQQNLQQQNFEQIFEGREILQKYEENQTEQQIQEQIHESIEVFEKPKHSKQADEIQKKQQEINQEIQEEEQLFQDSEILQKQEDNYTGKKIQEQINEFIEVFENPKHSKQDLEDQDELFQADEIQQNLQELNQEIQDEEQLFEDSETLQKQEDNYTEQKIQEQVQESIEVFENPKHLKQDLEDHDDLLKADEIQQNQQELNQEIQHEKQIFEDSETLQQENSKKDLQINHQFEEHIQTQQNIQGQVMEKQILVSPNDSGGILQKYIDNEYQILNIELLQENIEILQKQSNLQYEEQLVHVVEVQQNIQDFDTQQLNEEQLFEEGQISQYQQQVYEELQNEQLVYAIDEIQQNQQDLPGVYQQNSLTQIQQQDEIQQTNLNLNEDQNFTNEETNSQSTNQDKIKAQQNQISEIIFQEQEQIYQTQIVYNLNKDSLYQEQLLDQEQIKQINENLNKQLYQKNSANYLNEEYQTQQSDININIIDSSQNEKTQLQIDEYQSYYEENSLLSQATIQQDLNFYQESQNIGQQQLLGDDQIEKKVIKQIKPLEIQIIQSQNEEIQLYNDDYQFYDEENQQMIKQDQKLNSNLNLNLSELIQGEENLQIEMIEEINPLTMIQEKQDKIDDKQEFDLFSTEQVDNDKEKQKLELQQVYYQDFKEDNNQSIEKDEQNLKIKKVEKELKIQSKKQQKQTSSHEKKKKPKNTIEYPQSRISKMMYDNILELNEVNESDESYSQDKLELEQIKSRNDILQNFKNANAKIKQPVVEQFKDDELKLQNMRDKQASLFEQSKQLNYQYMLHGQQYKYTQKQLNLDQLVVQPEISQVVQSNNASPHNPYIKKPNQLEESLNDIMYPCETNRYTQVVCQKCGARTSFLLQNESWQLFAVTYGLRKSFRGFMGQIKSLIPDEQVVIAVSKNLSICFSQMDTKQNHSIAGLLNRLDHIMLNHPVINIPKVANISSFDGMFSEDKGEYSLKYFNLEVQSIKNQNIKIQNNYIACTQEGKLKVGSSNIPYSLEFKRWNSHHFFEKISLRLDQKTSPKILNNYLSLAYTQQLSYSDDVDLVLQVLASEEEFEILFILL